MMSWRGFKAVLSRGFEIMIDFHKNQTSGFADTKHDYRGVIAACKASPINTHGPHGSDLRETAETYRRELFRVGRFRVVVCCEGLQWLYQRRRPAITAGGVAWNTLGYCTDKKSLMRLHRAYGGAETQAIRDLPFHFTRGDQK